MPKDSGNSSGLWAAAALGLCTAPALLAVAAFILAMKGLEGWGWFLFATIFTTWAIAEAVEKHANSDKCEYCGRELRRHHGGHN